MGGAGDRRPTRTPSRCSRTTRSWAARREAGRVHPDAAVHAAAEGQPRGLDGRAKRRRRTTGSCSSSSSRSRRSSSARGRSSRASTRIRSSRRRSRCGTSRARGDPGHAAGDPDRGVAALRAAAVPAVARGPHSRAEARDRRLPEPDRHGGDARPGARPDLRPRPSPRSRPIAGEQRDVSRAGVVGDPWRPARPSRNQRR